MLYVSYYLSLWPLFIVLMIEEAEGSLSKHVEHGKDTVLNCEVERGQIINSLHWTHKRKPYCREKVIAELTSVSKEQNYEVTSAFKAESFNLKVSNMTQYKQGHYTCYANNVSKSKHALYMSGN